MSYDDNNKLSVMKDMGTMMAVGVVFCMVAALTVVPAVLVLPKLNEITGEIKALYTRIDAVEKEVGGGC